MREGDTKHERERRRHDVYDRPHEATEREHLEPSGDLHPDRDRPVPENREHVEVGIDAEEP